MQRRHASEARPSFAEQVMRVGATVLRGVVLGVGSSGRSRTRYFALTLAVARMNRAVAGDASGRDAVEVSTPFSMAVKMSSRFADSEQVFRRILRQFD